ncbi:hypothetical protein [Pararhodobacter oceanensis]|uniref:hypothetical protein n=1 Tax=Pararhodobacter oceanensis TaxID=2172121 RepID=UPI003A8FDD08
MGVIPSVLGASLFALSLLAFVPAAAQAQESATGEVVAGDTTEVGAEEGAAVTAEGVTEDVAGDATEEPAADASGAVTQESAENGPEGAALQLLDGLVTLTPGAGMVIAEQEGTARNAHVRLARAEAPEQPMTLLVMDFLPPSPVAIGRYMQTVLARTASIEAGEFQGIPVWIVEGASTGAPDGSSDPAAQSAAVRVILTQSCVDGRGALAIAATARADNAPAGGFEAMLAPLALSWPEDATPCPAELTGFMGEMVTRFATQIEETGEAGAGAEGAPEAEASTADASAAAPSDAESSEGLPDTADTEAAAPANTPLFAPYASAALPEATLATTSDDSGLHWTLLAHEAAPDSPHTALIAGDIGREVAGAVASVQGLFSAIDSIETGEHSGVPVTVIRGAAYLAAEGPMGAAGPMRAQAMVTQGCAPEAGALLLAVVTTPTRSAPIVMEAITGTLELAMPEGSEVCLEGFEAGLAEMAEALPEMRRAQAEAEAARSPEALAAAATAAVAAEDWQVIERFGLRLEAPADMRVRRDRDEAERQEIWLTNVDAETGLGSDVVLRVFTDAQRAALTTAPVESAEFASELARLSGQPMVLTDERVRIGSSVMRQFRSHEMREIEGEMRARQLLYLISEEASASGLHIWAAIANIGVEAPRAAAIEARVLAGLAMVTPERFEQAAAVEVPRVQLPEVVMPPVEVAPVEPSVEVPVEVPPVGGQPVGDEAEAWAQARALGTFEAVADFLSAYPEGLHAADARNWLARRGSGGAQAPAGGGTGGSGGGSGGAAPLVAATDAEAWQQVLALGTREAAMTYIKAFPQGAHLAEARAMLAGVAPPQAPSAPAKRAR